MAPNTPAGLYVGHHIDRRDRVTDTSQPHGRRVGIPKPWLPTHSLIAGQTGSGKSVLTQHLATSAHTILDGTRFVFDAKGDGLPTAIARSIYATQGHLDNVLYFPCAEVLPAVSLFDLRPAVANGVSRSLAADRIIDLYLNIAGRMSATADNWGNRARSVLRACLRALFDETHGRDCFSHRDVYQAIAEARDNGAVPATDNEDIATVLQTLQAEDADIREGTFSGVHSVLMDIQSDPALLPMLNNTPPATTQPPVPAQDTTTEYDGSSLFRFEQILDQDVTVIFDLSGYTDATQRRVTQLLTSLLWFGLNHRSTAEMSSENLLVIDEFSNLAPDNHFSKLLSEGRGLGLSVASIMQFPGQVEKELEASGNARLYDELLVESEQFIVGPLPNNDGPVGRLADHLHTEREVAQKLSELPKGKWLCQLTPGYGKAPTNTFTMRSPPFPPGHPDSSNPLTSNAADQFETALEDCRARTRRRFGINRTADTTTATPQAEETPNQEPTSLLDTTARIPDSVTLDAERNAICCKTCGNAYSPTFDGLVRAICCHSSLDAVDRKNIPPIECQLQLTPTDVTAAPVTRSQLRFLQLVWNTQRGRYHPLQFDLVTDSMTDLRAYAGVTHDDVTALQEAGLLKADEPFRRKLYSVTSDGWQQLNASPREGVDFGHGCGDQEETTTHVAMVEGLARYIHQEYVCDPDSPVSTVVKYFEPSDGTVPQPVVPTNQHNLPRGTGQSLAMPTPQVSPEEQGQLGRGPTTVAQTDVVGDGRLDVVGLTPEGEIHVVGEAERDNNDKYTSVPRDFDQMAALEPAEALWIAPTRQILTECVLTPLQDPADGEPRVESEYKTNTALRERSYATAGLTQVFSLNGLVNKMQTL